MIFNIWPTGMRRTWAVSDDRGMRKGHHWGLPLQPVITGRGSRHVSTSCCTYNPLGQPAFLGGTLLWFQSPYFYPDYNNQVLKELFKEPTVFFLFLSTTFFLMLYPFKK